MKRTGTTARAVALTVAALTLATACGGSDGDGGDSAATAKATDREGDRSRSPLESLIIAQRDLKGYTVTARKAEGWASGQPRSDDPKCQALAHSTGDRLSPEVKDNATRGVNRIKDPAKGVTVSLSSFAGDGAERTVDALEKAVRQCGKGFDTTLEGTKVGYRQVRAAETEPLGDQALAYSLTAESQGQRILLNFVAVRSGKTVALFAGVNLKEYAVGYRVPRELVEKQVAKLERARKSSGRTSATPERSGTGGSSGSGSGSAEPDGATSAPKTGSKEPGGGASGSKTGSTAKSRH
ncbi:hypothetical protein [Streptomyces sp. NPDC018031]|uniref:hypothetical protein n=1 Tax=Streptomyces sp. NPDC018031 TaxID=3365033 RepID=UPI0037A05CA0